MIDRKKIKLIPGIFILLLMIISFTSAEVVITHPTPSPSTISLNSYNPSQQLTFENTNTSEDISLSFSLSGDIIDIVSLSKTNLNIGTGTSYHDSITLSIPNGYENGGSFSGLLTYDSSLYGPHSIPINVVIGPAENSSSTGYNLIVFPTSKVVTVQQGNTKTQNIMITVPSNYPRPVTIQSVDFNPGTETIIFGDLNLGQIPPGSSIQIPIVFNGENAQTGNYQTQLSIFATDSEGQVALPTVSLQLQVTAGVSPVTEDTFSTAPTCSLSSTTFNLNATYSFTCSGVVSNLGIDIPSSEYWIGKNVEVSSGLYRYDFIPIKYGETNFHADFKYNGASIFSPFSQDVRITSSGSLVAGTSLKLIFTPKLDEATGDEDKYLIQLVDNKSGSLVSDPRIWVDAVELNSSTDTFEYAFDSNKNYSIRGKSPGYSDIVQIININPQKINIKINPGLGDTSTMFNITTSVENATIIINKNNYNDSYYGVLPEGVVEITAKKDGYKTEVINFTVEDVPRIVSFGGEFKKGVQQNFTLNKNVTWNVYYKKDLDSMERIEFAKGVGSLVQFTPDKKGIYTIEADGKVIGTYSIKGFSLKSKWLGLPTWVWIIIIIIIILIFAVFIVRSRMREDFYGGGQSHDDSGLSFTVEDTK